MLRDADHAIADQPIVRIGPVRRQNTEPFCHCRGDAMPTVGAVEVPQSPQRAEPVLGMSRASAISRAVVQAAPVLGSVGLLVYTSDEPSAAWSFISRRASRSAPAAKAASARSTRVPHSSNNDKCIHSDTAVPDGDSPIGVALTALCRFSHVIGMRVPPTRTSRRACGRSAAPPRPDPRCQDLGLPRCRRHVRRLRHHHHVE
jgi:hypothetical protein